MSEKDFDVDVLKGKISLNDYIQFMFEVHKQNEKILNKLDIIQGEIAKKKEEVKEESESDDFISGMMKSVIDNNPEILKMFGVDK